MDTGELLSNKISLFESLSSEPLGVLIAVSNDLPKLNETLAISVRTGILVFLIAGMLEVGLGLTFRQVVASLRDARRVMLALTVNFIVAPLLAVGIVHLLRLDQPFAAGLLLLGLAPGAPFIPKIVQLARGDLAFAVGLMVMFMVGTVIVLPLILPPIMVEAEVDAGAIAANLVLLMLLPLALGMVVRARLDPGFCVRVRSILGIVASASAVLAILMLVVGQYATLISFLGTGAVLAGVAFAVLTTLSGWLAGGRDLHGRRALGFATGSRNVPAALLVGTQNFHDPRVNLMIVVSALSGLLILIPVASYLGRQTSTLEVPREL